MRSLVRPLFLRVGYSSRARDQHLDVLLRMRATAWACAMDVSECVLNVRRDLATWMKQPDPDNINP
jgi:hypothetical protein